MPDSHKVSPVDYIVSNNYQFREKQNPHSSFGYLRTPEMAQIVREFINLEGDSFIQRIKKKILSFLRKYG